MYTLKGKESKKALTGGKQRLQRGRNSRVEVGGVPRAAEAWSAGAGPRVCRDMAKIEWIPSGYIL